MAEQPSGQDYLAVINVGSAGSWARDAVKEKAIKSVVRTFKQDFCKLYKLPKGTKITINVIDVTGHDKVYWDDSGFYTREPDEPGKNRIDRKIERVVHTY
jgi:hypothetical protein